MVNRMRDKNPQTGPTLLSFAHISARAIPASCKSTTSTSHAQPWTNVLSGVDCASPSQCESAVCSNFWRALSCDRVATAIEAQPIRIKFRNWRMPSTGSPRIVPSSIVILVKPNGAATMKERTARRAKRFAAVSATKFPDVTVVQRSAIMSGAVAHHGKRCACGSYSIDAGSTGARCDRSSSQSGFGSVSNRILGSGGGAE